MSTETATSHRYDICVPVSHVSLEVLLIEHCDLQQSRKEEMVSRIKHLADLDDKGRFKMLILVQQNTESYGFCDFMDLQTLYDGPDRDKISRLIILLLGSSTPRSTI